jgi:presqualene diphosphate synthase
MMREQPAATEALAKAPAASVVGSSFYLAMRILPRLQREAMFEVYSFCRAVDDIADDTAGSRSDRLNKLQSWRRDVAALYAGPPPPNLLALARAVQAFDLQREDFLAIIDGMEMDVVSDIRAPDLATLDLYCDRVACAVGRLSVRIFGVERAAGIALADHLGRALQLTNILRDLDEDSGMGRLYLPRETLCESGIQITEPAAVLSDPDIEKVCAAVARRAQGHFDQANTIMSRCPRRIVRTPKIMAEAYLKILNDLSARGWLPPRKRVRVGRWYFFWILLRHAVP